MVDDTLLASREEPVRMPILDPSGLPLIIGGQLITLADWAQPVGQFEYGDSQGER